MDRIEELMKNSDPARGIPTPGPLNLEPPHPDGSQGFIPTFVETADQATDTDYGHKSWYKKPAVWIAAVAAAAVVGTVWVFNPFGLNNTNPLPGDNSSVSSTSGAASSDAGTNSSSTSSSNSNSSSSASSSEPASSASTSSTTSSATTGGSANALPNGLLPAHPSVYWEDSAQCRAFNIGSVMVESSYRGEAEPLNGSPEDNPVVGCVDGYATYVGLTDKVYFEQELQDVALVIYVAEWDGEEWVVKYRQNADGAEYLTSVGFYPEFRSFPDADAQSAAERMNAQLATQEISVSDPEQLVGPNTATWEPQVEGVWTELEASKQGFTGEMRNDWTLVAKTNAVRDPKVDSVRLFDAYGATAIQLERWTTSSPDDFLQCNDPAATYLLHDKQQIDLRGEDDALSVALVTTTDVFGRETSAVRLIPSSAPTTGKACDLPAFISFGNDEYVDSIIRPTYGFESEGEQEEFLASVEWTDSVQFAKSLAYVSGSAQ